jgi:hypothetical protein
MKRLLPLLLIILVFACNLRSNAPGPKRSTLDSIFFAEGFDTAVNYSDTPCLLYKGKPLLTIGGQVSRLVPTFAFQRDTAGKYAKYPQLVTDYLSRDRFFSAKLTTGTIDGVLYFTADNCGRIIRIGGSWDLNADLVDTAGMEILGFLQNNYFPCLPQRLKTEQPDEVAHKNFKEIFRLYSSPDSADRDHGYKPHWSLDYSIALKRDDSL